MALTTATTTTTKTIKRAAVVLLGGAACATALAPASPALAMPAPKYLMVKDFRLCLASEPVQSYRRWCLPADKPEACPMESWEKLKGLTGVDQMPACEGQGAEKVEKPASAASGA